MSQSKPVSSESPLRIPLVEQCLKDKSFQIRWRAISNDWKYSKIIPQSMGGFNPLLSAAFVPGISKLNQWLENPQQSGRRFNMGNNLIHEVIALTHDYLHSWGYLAINELNPKLGFGFRPIDKSNFEDFVFCHLVTEAIAVIGLDYWYLSTVELNDICNMGTKYENLTISYHEKWLKEYRTFNPRFVVQKPQFFINLSKFYGTGLFFGFDSKAFKSSAMIEEWLEHEIRYGEMQRMYTRRWLHRFRAKDFELDRKRLAAPVAVSKKWQKDLLNDLSDLLWDKVKMNKLHNFSFRFKGKSIWKGYSKNPTDLRFCNLNTLDPEACYKDILNSPDLENNFKYFFYQYISHFDLASLDEQLLKVLPFLLEKKDFELIKCIFRGAKKVKSFGVEPQHLFFLA